MGAFRETQCSNVAVVEMGRVYKSDPDTRIRFRVQQKEAYKKSRY